MYLSIPLQIVKSLGIDSNLMVRTVPYLAHVPFVILCDYFFWRTLQKTVNRDCARLTFFLYFFNRHMTMYMIRTCTNAIETTGNVVAYYFFLEQKNKFTLSTVIMTAVISLTFMIRTTAPVGWIPLLAYKILFEGSLLPFLISGVTVALPACFLCVAIDTFYYESDSWVVTGYNFFDVNIKLGISKTFGTDDFFYYIRVVIPYSMSILVPAVYIGLVQHYKR